jgi:hypothetical protein
MSVAFACGSNSLRHPGPKKPGTPRSSGGSLRLYKGRQQPHVARRPVRAQGNVGPGSYSLKAAVGNQTQSQRATSAAFSFGSPRPRTSKKRTQRGYKDPKRPMNEVGEARFIPGPGTYPSPSSMGVQRMSFISTAPSSSFSKSALGDDAKVYMPGFSEIDNAGKLSQGPASYSPTHTFAKMSSPAYSMRWRDKKLAPEKQAEKDNAIPGPGNYKAQVRPFIPYITCLCVYIA